jgi:hypothetical protein
LRLDYHHFVDPAKAVLPSIEKLVATRYGTAQRVVEQILTQDPTARPDDIARQLQRRYSKELGAVAALSGGAAAVPGAGTVTALAAAGADLAYTMTKLGEMIMAIGIAYGHDAQSVTERKAWVLTVLSMGRGAAIGIDGVAARFGERGGAALVARLSATQIDSLNSKLAASLVTRLTTQQGVARLSRLLPFGIGAGVGATGNVLLVRTIARSAQHFFGSTPGPRSSVINADSTEVTDIKTLPSRHT